MPTLTAPRAGYEGEGMATFSTASNEDTGLGFPMGFRNIRHSDGSSENVPNTTVFIKKIIVTNAGTAATTFRMDDINGTLFKIFLEDTINRQVPGLLNRRPPPTFLVPALDTIYTSEATVIDFPEPGLRAEGNIGVGCESGEGAAAKGVLYYTYAHDTPGPVVGP